MFDSDFPCCAARGGCVVAYPSATVACATKRHERLLQRVSFEDRQVGRTLFNGVLFEVRPNSCMTFINDNNCVLCRQKNDLEADEIAQSIDEVDKEV